jgi:hypothetical protein
MAFLPVSVNETTGGKYTEITIMESGCLGMIVISICVFIEDGVYYI